MRHRNIADYLYEKHGVPGWWAQMVTVTYERERGLREKHQKPDGYEVSRAKTIGVPVEALFAAWQDEKIRAKWLKEPGIVVRKATRAKSMRITWSDGRTSVDVNFWPKGDAKSQVQVQHGKLVDAKEAERKKVYWEERLVGLKALLEG
jgi:hypothetical protein